jgi:uncharacterized membrane protein
MQFASPIPWWLALAAAAGIASLAYVAYRRSTVPLSPARRATLTILRALSLAAILVFLCRPIVMRPPAGGGEIVVPILIDGSRSMRVADAGGQPRIARALSLVNGDLLPALTRDYKPELLVFGESLAAADSTSGLAADAPRTDLMGALRAVRDRYRGRPVAGVVVISDGADTGSAHAAADQAELPVFAIGVGSADGVADREVMGLTAGDPRLDQASVDLRVAAVARGFGRTPFEVRVLANGRLVESRMIAPAGDGTPVDELFTVLPDPLNATVYSAEIAADPSEAVVENNVRNVLVSPAGRRRRILALQGAPGYDHSFLARVLSVDPGLEIDSIVRKGRNEVGQNTFLVQAEGGRAATLTSGFPETREALYAYDAVIAANIEGDFFTRAQLSLLADFVAERGGGLLVLGGRAFADRGLLGTPLEAVLPLELNDRRGGLPISDLGVARTSAHHTVMVTSEGLAHPVMRLTVPASEARAGWAKLPPLAAVAPLGGPRAGATVLAVTAASSGAVYPLVAVQRYGRGRSMIFSGEASWRWRMLSPIDDRTYEFFWRQSARWLAAASPDPVSIAVPDAVEPGDAIEIVVEARDASYKPAANATVEATVAAPGVDPAALALRREAGEGARHVAPVRFDQPGLYRVRAEARLGGRSLGVAERFVYVGGYDREFTDPRLNEGVLRRLAAASGGRYVSADSASTLPAALRAGVLPEEALEQRDLWHTPWAIALVLALLSAEWVLRRRWGLR